MILVYLLNDVLLLNGVRVTKQKGFTNLMSLASGNVNIGMAQKKDGLFD